MQTWDYGVRGESVVRDSDWQQACVQTAQGAGLRLPEPTAGGRAAPGRPEHQGPPALLIMKYTY